MKHLSPILPENDLQPENTFFSCYHNFTILDQVLNLTNVVTSKAAHFSCIMKIKKISCEMKGQQRR
jgi:hypothetical protein